MKNLLFGLLAATLLYSCSADPKNDTSGENKSEETKKAACTYSIMPQSTAAISWTAFKFTDKVGVGGTFDKVRIGGNKNISANVTDIINGAQFIIVPESVNSNLSLVR